MVATQVTTAITNSKLITSLPSLLFQQKADRVGRRRLNLGISNALIISYCLYGVNNGLHNCVFLFTYNKM